MGLGLSRRKAIEATCLDLVPCVLNGVSDDVDDPSEHLLVGDERRRQLHDRVTAIVERCSALDDRGDPVVQLSPPLVADQQVLGRIVDIVADAVEHAWNEVEAGGLDRLAAAKA